MKSILYIGNKLNNKESNVSAITTLGNLFKKEGYQLYFSSSKNNKLLRLLDMLRACYIYRNKVDYVIIDTYSTLNFYYAYLVSQLCRLLNLKYIPRLNGGNLPNRLRTSKKLCSLIFNNAYINISPSLYLKDAFNRSGYNNVKYIPNALEIENYKFNERTYSEIKLLWVRSFSKIYNPKLAVRVLKELLDQGYKAELCMVGPDSDGSYKEVKYLCAELNVEVIFTGKLPKEEWLALAKNYNVFINTTNFDNMPVSVVEAMALGLVVVSTNVGGIPYLINNTHDGILVEKDNLSQMVEAIINLSKSEANTISIALNARKKIENFNWEKIKIDWFKILS